MAEGTSSSVDAALDVQRMSKTFNGRRVLADMELRLVPGDIHAIVGQNGCGKSTFVKCLSGFYEPDAGATVRVAGATLTTPYGPHEATAAGLRFVHQDLGIVPGLSVTENLGLGRGYVTATGGRVDWKKEHARAGQVLERIHCADIAPGAPAGTLSTTSRAMVAIARAMGSAESEASVVVLDEPSASLPEADVKILHRTIRRTAAHGVAIVLISHRMSEVFELATHVTVMRDGLRVGTYETGSLDEHRLAELIVGRAVALEERDSIDDAEAMPERLAVRDLTGGSVDGLDLTVAAGEIVGIAGLRGSGRSTMARLLGGVQLADRGTVSVDGTALGSRSADAMARTVVYVPEDRKSHGIVAGMSILENLLLPRMKDFRGIAGLKRAAMRAEASRLVAEFAVNPPDYSASITSLSGGNQQKVVLARWFSLGPKVAILDEPFQGIDVGAKDEIFSIIADRAAEGVSVVIVDSDFENLSRMCDRILIVYEGQVVEEITGDHVREVDEVTKAVLLAHLPPSKEPVR